MLWFYPSGQSVRPAGSSDLSERLLYSMLRKPSDDEARIERIRALCAHMSKTVKASRQHRRASREAPQLTQSAGVKRKGKGRPKS